MEETAGAVRAFASALAESDADRAVREMVLALRSGAPVRRLQRAVLREMAANGEELHSMIYTSAAFDLSEGLGAEAGKYPLAAAVAQVARRPKNDSVAKWVAEAQAAGGRPREPFGISEVERALFEALDGHEVARAVGHAVELHRHTGEGAFVVEAFARWGSRPEVIEEPAGYVSHLPLQVDAALNLLKVAGTREETDLLLGHLAYCQAELYSRYRTRRVAPEPVSDMDEGDALAGLAAAIHGRKLGAVHGLLAQAAPSGRSLEAAARTVARCALEAEGGLSHRFTLAGAAWRTARTLHRAVGRAVLHHAALSIAHGYVGPRRLLELRDLPHPHPGGSDYPGRLLVGLASGNLAEAHAALRGLFESGASPRAAALPFVDAASQLDAHNLHTDHGFILTQAAWRLLSDGSLAGEAVPLLAELAARIAKAPKDHELIALVEDAAAAPAPA